MHEMEFKKFMKIDNAKKNQHNGNVLYMSSLFVVAESNIHAKTLIKWKYSVIIICQQHAVYESQLLIPSSNELSQYQ